MDVFELRDWELVLMGNLNWDWLSANSNSLKNICNELNLIRIYNIQISRRDLLTNTPQKYNDIGVFSNDISDHCTVACARDTKLPKCKPRILIKIHFKTFLENAFLHDLNICNFSRISFIPDIYVA